MVGNTIKSCFNAGIYSSAGVNLIIERNNLSICNGNAYTGGGLDAGVGAYGTISLGGDGSGITSGSYILLLKNNELLDCKVGKLTSASGLNIDIDNYNVDYSKIYRGNNNSTATNRLNVSSATVPTIIELSSVVPLKNEVLQNLIVSCALKLP